MKHTYLPLLIAALYAAPTAVPPCGAQALPAATMPPATAPATAAPAPVMQYWIGVAVQRIAPPVAAWLKLTPGQGLVVSHVIPDSPAAAAGLQVNDLLIAIDGKPLLAPAQLIEAAQPVLENSALVVKPLTLEYLHNGDCRRVQITPQPRPAALVLPAPLPGALEPGMPPPGGPNRVALQNGGFLEIGTGYRLDLKAPRLQALDLEQFRKVVQRGQTVIISQHTDAAGHVRSSITLGAKTYEITAANFATLPPEIRTLAQATGLAPATSTTAPANPPGATQPTLPKPN